MHRNHAQSSFESAVLESQDAREQNLTTFRKRAVPGLLLQQNAAPEVEPESDSIIDPAMRRLKKSVNTAKSEYQNTRYLLPTFNIWERWLSMGGHALTNHGWGTLSHNFEIQLFL